MINGYGLVEEQRCLKAASFSYLLRLEMEVGALFKVAPPLFCREWFIVELGLEGVLVSAIENFI